MLCLQALIRSINAKRCIEYQNIIIKSKKHTNHKEEVCKNVRNRHALKKKFAGDGKQMEYVVLAALKPKPTINPICLDRSTACPHH